MKTEIAAVLPKNAQVLLGLFPIVTPQGDGSYLVRPSKPVSQLTVTQAAAALHISPRSVYRKIEEGQLEAHRILRRKYLITPSAVEAYRAKTADPEYWDRN